MAQKKAPKPQKDIAVQILIVLSGIFAASVLVGTIALGVLFTQSQLEGYRTAKWSEQNGYEASPFNTLCEQVTCKKNAAGNDVCERMFIPIPLAEEVMQ